MKTYVGCSSGTSIIKSSGYSKYSGSCPLALSTNGKTSHGPAGPGLPFQPNFMHSCGGGASGNGLRLVDCVRIAIPKRTHLGNVDVYGIANYAAVAGPVARIGDQLAVPDAVIVPAVAALAEDGYGGPAEGSGAAVGV